MPSSSMGGYGSPFDALTIEEETASYTAVNADFRGGVAKSMNVGADHNFTINDDITNDRPLTIINEGSGLCTIVAGSGVTLKSPGSVLRLTEQYSWATITPDPSAANTYWVIGGLS